MATIYDLLPKFKQLEVNNLKGLQPGFVVAQMNVAQSEINKAASTGTLVKKLGDGEDTHFFVENGRLCQISADGIKAADGTEKTLFIAYNDPLHLVTRHYNHYATDIADEDVRLVQLIPGDEWMSDIDPDDAAYAAEITAGRIVEVHGTEGQSYDDFLAVDTLPDGTPAHHYMFLG